MRFAGEEELAARGLGDGCGDLMFFSSVLDFFIYYGSLVVSYRFVFRLVPPSREASRLFRPVVSLLARVVLISSRCASRFSSRFPVSSFLLRFPWHSVLSVLPFLCLVVSSFRGVLLTRLVSFSFVLSPSSCGFR